jgi:surface antigen
MSDARDNGKSVLSRPAEVPSATSAETARPDRHRLGRNPGPDGRNPARDPARPGRLGRRPAAARPVAAIMGAGVLAAAILGAVTGQPAVARAQVSAAGPSAIVCAGWSGCDGRGDSSHDYAAHENSPYWRMIAGNECTNYVAYVESTVFGAPTPSYLLGNAGQWPASAEAHGVTVNGVPSVGAVAEWDGGAAGMGAMGHVAVVEQVGPDDSYIVISQQHIGSDPDGYDWTRINAGFPAADWQEWPSHFIHFAPAAGGGATVGLYNPQAASYRLQTSLTGASPAITFRRGAPGEVPLAGDWAGRGSDGTGYYNPRTGWFHLRDQAGPGPSSRSFAFGPPGMVPLAGNWDGHGGDSVGYYDPATGTFHLRNYLSDGRAQDTFAFGPPGMIPLAGDWTGSGRTGIGYYNPATGWFHLRSQLSAGPADDNFRFGPPGMKPVIGNWTGGLADEIGYYNPGTGWFHLRDHLSGGAPSRQFKFGPAGQIPLAGDWAGA